MSAQIVSTAPKPFAFVLMPFDEAFEDVYELGIKLACQAAGAYCERVDEQIFDERILDRIYNQIAKADLVIADMTGRNPNVFYEVGYAHALGKLTILLTRDLSDIPFDLKHFPYIIYGKKISFLQSKLEKRVKHFIENPPSKLSDIRLGLELFLEGQSLIAGETTIYTIPENQIPNPEFTIFNGSSTTFAPGDFKIGVLTSLRFSFSRTKGVISTKIPSGGYIHTLPDFPTLFPGAYASYGILLDSRGESYMTAGEKEMIKIRLFTRHEQRDFPAAVCAGIESKV